MHSTHTHIHTHLYLIGPQSLDTTSLEQGELFFEAGIIPLFKFCSPLSKLWVSHIGSRCGLISFGWPGCLTKCRSTVHTLPLLRMPHLLHDRLRCSGRAGKPRGRGGTISSALLTLAQGDGLSGENQALISSNSCAPSFPAPVNSCFPFFAK